MAERCTYLQAALRRAAHLPDNCRRQNGVGRDRLAVLRAQVRHRNQSGDNQGERPD